jgi:hypothetical protein
MPPAYTWPQQIENKALSRGIIGKLAPILAEITMRKSQKTAKELSRREFLRRAFPGNKQA